MLKIFRKLCLGLIVIVGSAGVTPTPVSSTSLSGEGATVSSLPMLAYVQAGAPSAALQEAVVVFSPSSEAITMAGWCLKSKSAGAFACFEVPVNETDDLVEPTLLPSATVEPQHYIRIVSQQYAEAHPVSEADTYDLIYEAGGRSGSIVGTTDVIELINEAGETVSQFEWSDGTSTKVWMREEPRHEAAWSAISIPSVLPVDPFGVTVVVEEPGGDEGALGDGDGETDGIDSPETPEPTEPPEGVEPVLVLTELLANPAGSDVGNEFIELYNPTNEAVSFEDYGLIVGARRYNFPAESAALQPGEYRAFYNDVLRFTLPNTTGSVQLAYGGNAYGNAVTYDAPKDGMAWALTAEGWKYTSQPSPGAENTPPPLDSTLSEDEAKDTSAAQSALSTLKPCAPHQERNPLTNRCRNKVVASAQKPCNPDQVRNPETGRCKAVTTITSPAPCKAGQFRNPETGRCKALATTSGPAPCKPGQERNPETNRCRTVQKMTPAPHPVAAIQEKATGGPAWYAWVAVVGIILAVIGYAAWEWRVELTKYAKQLKARWHARG